MNVNRIIRKPVCKNFEFGIFEKLIIDELLLFKDIKIKNEIPGQFADMIKLITTVVTTEIEVYL